MLASTAGDSYGLGGVFGEVLCVDSDVLDAVSEAACRGKRKRHSWNQLPTHPTLEALRSMYDGHGLLTRILAQLVRDVGP